MIETAVNKYNRKVISIAPSSIDKELYRLAVDGESLGRIRFAIADGRNSLRNIEIYDKGKGYGTSVIEALINLTAEQERDFMFNLVFNPRILKMTYKNRWLEGAILINSKDIHLDFNDYYRRNAQRIEDAIRRMAQIRCVGIIGKAKLSTN